MKLDPGQHITFVPITAAQTLQTDSLQLSSKVRYTSQDLVQLVLQWCDYIADIVAKIIEWCSRALKL